jgi:hypothetical protein
MIFLDCSGVSFGPQLDEKHLFQWAREIDCFIRWQQDILVARSRRISQAALRELIAIFWRYCIPMQQLAKFQNNFNEYWFTSPTIYWYKKVFG